MRPGLPDLPADAVLAATARRWDTSGPLPLPRPGWLACPVCRDGTVQIRYWKYHERKVSPTVRYRCDVSFKCCECAAVWLHGVAIDDDVWERRPLPERGTAINWREGQALLAL